MYKGKPHVSIVLWKLHEAYLFIFYLEEKLQEVNGGRKARNLGKIHT